MAQSKFSHFLAEKIGLFQNSVCNNNVRDKFH
jgi:hypothetical protein